MSDHEPQVTKAASGRGGLQTLKSQMDTFLPHLTQKNTAQPGGMGLGGGGEGGRGEGGGGLGGGEQGGESTA